MIQVIPQTRDEKIAMYMKLTKRELAEMLAGANEHVDRLSRQPAQWYPPLPPKYILQPMTVTTTWPPTPNTCGDLQ